MTVPHKPTTDAQPITLGARVVTALTFASYACFVAALALAAGAVWRGNLESAVIEPIQWFVSWHWKICLLLILLQCLAAAARTTGWRPIRFFERHGLACGWGTALVVVASTLGSANAAVWLGVAVFLLAGLTFPVVEWIWNSLLTASTRQMDLLVLIAVVVCWLPFAAIYLII